MIRLCTLGIELDRDQCRELAIQYMRSGRTRDAFNALLDTLQKESQPHIPDPLPP